LEKIANQGIDVFYKGEIGEFALHHVVKPYTNLTTKAESMIDFIQKTNGIMTLEDLDGYTVNVKPPLNITFGDFRLFATEAPSSGAVTFSMFKTMEQYGFTNINLTTHRFVEAMKFAYGARLQFGDPAFVKNASALETFLLSDDTAQDIHDRILDDRTQPVEVYDPLSLYMPESHGTSHVVAADASGLTVSSTTTINLLFGAQIMTPDTGIIL
jgi:gamma-glutamyltranspeptidase/glutathione hydrolase